MRAILVYFSLNYFQISVIPELVSQSCARALHVNYLSWKCCSLHFLLHGCSAARNEKYILLAQVVGFFHLTYR